MLMNGKEVNNIVIGGQTFVREGLAPGLYSFPNQTEGNQFEYKLTISNGIPSFSPITYGDDGYEHFVDINKTKTLVIRIIDDGNNKYALVGGRRGTSSSHSSTSTYLFIWIKIAEFGNKMVRLPSELYPDVNNYLKINTLP